TLPHTFVLFVINSCHIAVLFRRVVGYFHRLTIFLGVSVAAYAGTSTEKVDFNYDIRPILSQKCYHCHGPDEGSRKAKLRLDIREDTLKDRDGFRAIVPGDSKASEMIVRIHSKDEEEQMPPPKEGEALTQKEIELLTRW